MTKQNKIRKHISKEIEAIVLLKGARRCPVCFYLNGDLTQKHGQIAHLDRNPSNASEENLAFMCMAHHSDYDSTTRQHKNFTLAEVKAMRLKLYEAIASGARQQAWPCPHNLIHIEVSSGPTEEDQRDEAEQI